MKKSNDNNYALLGDVPVKEDKARGDLLRFTSTAEVLADAVVNTPNPLTVGIFGEWGSGKTSLMYLIKEEVDKNNDVATVWFNAWQFEKEEHLIVPLVATINRELDKETWPDKIKQGAKNLREALRAIAYGFSIKGKVGIPLISEAEINLSSEKMIQRYQELTKDTVLFRSLYFDAFEHLRKCAENPDTPRVIVFVDDLDRCFPNRAVELLEGIKLVLHQPGFSFVLGVNELIINAFITTKYAKDFNIDKLLFEDYMDKIVQVKIPVPKRDSVNMKDFVSRLLREGGIFSSDESSLSEGADQQADIPDELIELVAEAGKHNPRAIVRLLNRILITSRISQKEGKNYNSQALLIHIATDEPRYAPFRKALDITVIVDEIGEKKGESEITIGQLLSEKLGACVRDHGKLIDSLYSTKLKSREDVLKGVMDILERNPHLFALLRSEIGRKWLSDKEYRNGLGEISAITAGERKPQEKEEPAMQAGGIDPIRELLNNFVEIPAGKFMMGSPENDKEANESEHPEHPVVLQAFELSAMPVTQAQYEALMGTNPSHFHGPDNLNNPVEQVSWEEAKAFCEKLTEREKRTSGMVFTLPSEAQWEYACRAGGTGKYCFGDDETLLEAYAWYGNRSGRQTHPVGTKKPNAWGIYDMHGNVWEWCLDSWHDTYNNGAPDDGSAWDPDSGSFRVMRGGGWSDPARSCRSASRNGNSPGDRDNYLGFRVLAVRQSVEPSEGR